MKKRYSEYVGYNYTGIEEWFNPQVEWDTQLFIDPMLLKYTQIKEFKDSFNRIVDYFSKAIVKMNSNIPYHLKEQMVCFDEVKEANLGFSYDSNNGSGLTGKTAISVLKNIEKFTSKGIFSLEDFANISLFDKNVNSDRITDMIINIIKNDFIEYSNHVATNYSFPTKKFKIKQEFNFNEMRWHIDMIEMPYIINDEGREIPVLLIPKGLLGSNVYCNDDNFMTWIYHNSIDYVKETFDYNLKSEIVKNRKKILADIIDNQRNDILQRFNRSAKDIKPYDINEDKNFVYKIYEDAKKFYEETKQNFLPITENKSELPVKDVVEILIKDLQIAVTDKKGYCILKNKNKTFIAEPKISKFVHIVFDARIKDAGFNVDISPETNAGFGPVDFKISRGQDKVLIENKISSNPKLLTCIDDDKQIHAYLKSEECHNAYLLVFIDKKSDIDKLNELNRKATKYKDEYIINIKDIDCIEKESASHR